MVNNMRGEQYFLILIGKDGTKYKVYNKPISLKTMDEHTTKYKNKNELVSQILSVKKFNIDVSDITNVQIYMRPNSKKEEYKIEKGPLYKKDASVLNKDAIAAKFETMILDKNFVLEFIKKYSTVKNFASILNGIKALIKNNSDEYIDLISSFAEKIFSTYKGSRNIYLFMKKYENKKKIRHEYIDVSQIPFNSSLDEINEDRLKYLIDHERELLDIEDFNHYQDLSVFDGSRKTK